VELEARLIQHIETGWSRRIEVKLGEETWQVYVNWSDTWGYQIHGYEHLPVWIRTQYKEYELAEHLDNLTVDALSPSEAT